MSRRLFRIMRTLVRYRLDTLLDATGLDPAEFPAAARIFWALRPSRFLPRPKRSSAERLRLALEDLGPVYVKFGQIISTRKDLLSPDFAAELSRLQDKVPPFPSDEARALIEAAIGQPVERAFARFDQAPMASASVAQVHGAQLHDGREVVVKIIRPGIDAVIREDLALMHQIAALLERASAEARRAHLKQLVVDYEQTIFGELNLIREGANTAQLRRNFPDSSLIYVPEVYWPYTSRNVLVLERIYGVPIARTDILRERGTDMKVLAERGVETFFTQVFVHNFFHADMHPGNIFVDISNPASPRYMAIDCAIIGSLTDEDQDYLARNLLAFFNHDYREVARLHLESGWVPPKTNIDDFEAVIREVCEPIFAKPLKDISFGHFLVSLFQAARQFEMEVQPQLVLLQKTLLNIEGLGRQLYPDLDLWETAKPFMERWMAQRVGPLAALRKFSERAPALLKQLPELPDFLLEAPQRLARLERLNTEQLRLMQTMQDGLTKQRIRNTRRWRRLAGLALLGVSGWLWFGLTPDAEPGWSILSAGVVGAVVGLALVLRPGGR